MASDHAHLNEPRHLREGSEHEEIVTSDPYQSRRQSAAKVVQAIGLLFGILETLLAFRFALRMLGANPRADFTEALYGVTAPFVAPFEGIFGTPSANGGVLEPHTALAFIVYALVGWALVRFAWIALSDERRATTTRSHETRSLTR